MKSLLFVLMGAIMLSACGKEDGKPQSASQAGSFFGLHAGGDVVQGH